MNDLEIRTLDAADVRPLSDAFIAIGWDRPPAWFQRYIDEAQTGARKAWIALVGGEPAGYVTLVPRSSYAPLADIATPEVLDLNVLPRFRRRGIASRLLDVAEAEAAQTSGTIAIGVGLHAGYNAAQRLYVKRGYVPDGRGVTYHDRFVGEYETLPMDDDLVLHLTKDLRRRARLIPQLSAQDVGAYVSFLRDAFGFELRSEWEDPGDAEHVNVEVELDDAVVGIGRSAAATDPSHIGLYVIVDDVDAHYSRARSAEAEITYEIADQPWGHRMYGARDPEGHDWGFATPSPISRFDDTRRRGDADFAAAASAMGSPLYGLSDDRPMDRIRGGHGSGGGTSMPRRYNVTLRHRWPGVEVDVLTDTETRSYRAAPASMLGDWLLRRVHAAAGIDFPFRVEVDRWSAPLAVDGGSVRFDVVGDATSWEGAAVVGERLVRLTVVGATTDELSLRTVDPAEYRVL